MNNRTEIHDRVLKAQDLEELSGAYREWASNYDEDLIDRLGYQAPQKSVQLLVEHLPDRSVPVLDAGCGTGLVGQLLQAQGVGPVDGVDYSESMLQEAQAKQCYRNLSQADLNQALTLEDDTYGATLCVGTFTTGHVRPEALRELIRVTRSGGLVGFTVRDSYWEEAGFAELLDALDQEGTVELLQLLNIAYIVEEGSRCRLVLLRVNG